MVYYDRKPVCCTSETEPVMGGNDSVFLHEFIYNMYPGPRGFSWAVRVAKRGEREKHLVYLGLESHFHADARVRI